jgi:o-succinylbenzoate---CoA ligase
MNNNLLKYLKSSVDRDWFNYYSSDLVSNEELKAKQPSSKLLYQLTQAKLPQISNSQIKVPKKLAVLIVEDNPVDFIAAVLAGVIMEVNLFLGDRAWQQQEWQQVLNLVQPDLVFGNHEIKSLICELNPSNQNRLDLIDHTNTNLARGSLIMIPTGGTSGKIRFVMHNLSTLTASVSGFTSFFGCQRINSFCTLPLYHVSGLMQFWRSLLTQGNFVICPYKVVATQPPELNKAEYFISLVPTQLQFLLAHTPNWLSKFKTVLLGGAPASPSLLTVAREYKIAVSPIYGMSETASGVVALKPQEFLAGNNSSGQVLPHAQVSINNVLLRNGVRIEGEYPSKKTKTTAQKIGSIEITSASLCLGYYPQLFTPAQPFVTDDLGYFDGEGYLHLIGRNSQKIITGGENVFPAEVAAAIYSTKLVKDIWVLGIPDRQWGETVTAIYVPLESADNLNLIKQQIKLQLAKYKQPKNWIEVDRIPRNDRGKVNCQQLKAIAIKAIAEK